jgi:hypothetical protein
VPQGHPWFGGAGTRARRIFTGEGLFSEEADGGAEDRPGGLRDSLNEFWGAFADGLVVKDVLQEGHGGCGGREWGWALVVTASVAIPLRRLMGSKLTVAGVHRKAKVVPAGAKRISEMVS